MKFIIDFNKQVFLKQQQLYFKLTFQKSLKANEKNLVIAMSFLFLGFFIVYQFDNIGYVVLAYGIHKLINVINYYEFYKKSKKTYFKLIDRIIIKELKFDKPSVWEFNEDNLHIISNEAEYTIKWSLFKDFRIIENSLFLDLDLGKNQSYILSEEEFVKDQFQKILEFIKIKII
jgi:hypothetical protein